MSAGREITQIVAQAIARGEFNTNTAGAFLLGHGVGYLRGAGLGDEEIVEFLKDVLNESNRDRGFGDLQTKH